MNVFISVNAIEFLDNTFHLSPELKEDLRSSIRPNILLLVGPARSGKSSLGNVIIHHSFNPEIETFKTDEGNIPVAMEIQYCKLMLSDLLRINGIDMNLSFDSEIFIFDCEGIDSLDNVTVLLRKAIMSLLQISTVNIFVSKNIDRSNIFSMKAFFLLPQLIPGTQQKLNKNWAIVLTEIGVPGKPSKENYEEKRKENDENELKKFLGNLSDQNINFNKENTAFFAQPRWKDKENYFESINDLIRFIVSGVSKRIPIPGKGLIDIFENIFPKILEINDLDNPDVGIADIVQNLIHQYFKKAKNHALQRLPNLINEKFNNQTARYLIGLSGQNYYNEIQETIIHLFEHEANMIFENLTNLFPEEFQNFVNVIKINVVRKTTKAYENICKLVIIPYVYDQIKNTKKDQIRIYFNYKDSSALRQINQEVEIEKYQREAYNSFTQQINAINPILTSKQEFISKIHPLYAFISEEVILAKRRRFLECPPWPSNLTEAIKAGQTGPQVTLWPYGSSGKNATFDVVEGKLQIPGLKATFTDRETKDNFQWIMSTKTSSIKVEIDINSMVITIPSKRFLYYRIRKYHLGLLHSKHFRYHFQIITITLPSPFCFADGSTKYMISSKGGIKKVPPIAFKII